MEQQHPGGSWGYRFENGGRSIVYSSDSEHGPGAEEADYAFLDFFRECDVLVFDGQYSLEESSNEKRNWGHSNQITGVQLAARARAGTLVVFHHDPANSDAALERLLERASAYRDTLPGGADAVRPQRILLAYDGLRVRA
jgi:ribonuclease BN (tRNA processing enzyme)